MRTRGGVAGVVFAAALLLAPSHLAGQAPAPEAADGPAGNGVTAAIDRLLEEAVAADSVPGITAAAVRGGEILLARGYGLADLEQRVPVTVETVMRIGSVTKQFTAALVMQLVETDEVELDAPIARYLDGTPDAWSDVTVHQLLNHTSGIPSYTGLDDFWSRIGPLDLSDDELVATFRDVPADFPPGSEFRYNNSGYYLLGMIVADVTGRTYREALRARLLGPLGLAHTHYCDDEPIIPGRARGYAYRDGDLENARHISMETPGAAGAMCSTALDLVRWTRALRTGRVVEPSSLERMTTPEAPADSVGYGYGLRLSELAGRRVVGHGGSINGFNAALLHVPDEELTVAVIVNAGEGAGALAGRIAARVLGAPVAARGGGG